ncbi:hypothetical protein Pmani_022784 [Petrolisthes manimaculis]|uniref:Uncharacterized protein n=1 Tax=Petrolisthes manimaculis TaxID=1843537 RepID=A0AAE1PBG3_9EUCA|nr:hypothetical protein Pmani_022784 [Petrolisthes manimaculis]
MQRIGRERKHVGYMKDGRVKIGLEWARMEGDSGRMESEGAVPGERVESEARKGWIQSGEGDRKTVIFLCDFTAEPNTRTDLQC